MAKLTFKFSLKVPVLYTSDYIRYKVTKKPDGISYLLLVLISHGQRKKLTNLLTDFGIPEDLKYLCNKALQNLLNTSMINNVTGISKNFDDYLVNDFKFTPEGEKVFKEGIIVTGKELSVEPNGFYYPYLDEFKLVKPGENHLDKMDSNKKDLYLPNGVTFKDDVIENYYESCKTKLNIKDSEIIISVTNKSYDYYLDDAGASLIIDDETSKIQMNKEKYNGFGNSYPKELFEERFENDPVFKFANIKSINNNYNIRNIKEDIVAGYLPKEFEKEIKNNHYKFIKCPSDYSSNNFDCDYRGDKANELEYITIDKNYNIYGYYNKKFITNELPNINIPLSIKVKLTNERAEELLKDTLQDKLNPKVLNVYDRFFKDKEALEENLSRSCKEYKYYNVDEIKCLLDSFEDGSELYNYANEIVSNIYNNGLKEQSQLSGLKQFLSITKSYADNAQHIDEIIDIAKSLKISECETYSLLMEGGMDSQLVLTKVNPFVDVDKAKESEDVNLISYFAFESKLQKLIDHTGITNPKIYVYEDIEPDDVYINTYLSLKKDYELASQFSSVLGDEFKTKEYYFNNVFTPIYNEMLLYKASMTSINGIKAKTVNKKIDKGNFTEAFANLSALLANYLKKVLKLSGTLTPMLKDAKDKKLIDGKLADDLLEMTDNRNKIIHLESNQKPDYTPDDLRRWCEEVFILIKGEK